MKFLSNLNNPLSRGTDSPMPNAHFNISWFFLRTLLLFLIICSLFISCSCSKSGTDPPPPPVKPDTTSHDIEWQEFTFGYRNSTLNDVCIINENNIWA
ncbi:MAG: hypothetical protein GWN00_04240, partial [Aliifodinibius sp.]|nr:hypothetical protein [candidate division KSB1 bacterium]NIS44810.1 hypothetical protein [candidate division Zixibacteria bacterium]NIT55457.1 hypothetical protein [Fodinibius sp.]NIW43712.1 hypothetical protein [Gammaproteobacteria bacterium]NIU12903.1 hypothetical protein [candidate division Zixibacteria bacterium]